VLPDRLEEGVELPDVDALLLRTVELGLQVGKVALQHRSVDPVHPLTPTRWQNTEKRVKALRLRRTVVGCRPVLSRQRSQRFTSTSSHGCVIASNDRVSLPG